MKDHYRELPDRLGLSSLPPTPQEPTLNLADKLPPPMALSPDTSTNDDSLVYDRGPGLPEEPAAPSPPSTLPIPTGLPIVPAGPMPVVEGRRADEPAPQLPIGTAGERDEIGDQSDESATELRPGWAFRAPDHDGTQPVPTEAEKVLAHSDLETGLDSMMDRYPQDVEVGPNVTGETTIRQLHFHNAATREVIELKIVNQDGTGDRTINSLTIDQQAAEGDYGISFRGYNWESPDIGGGRGEVSLIHDDDTQGSHEALAAWLMPKLDAVIEGRPYPDDMTVPSIENSQDVVSDEELPRLFNPAVHPDEVEAVFDYLQQEYERGNLMPTSYIESLRLTGWPVDPPEGASPGNEGQIPGENPGDMVGAAGGRMPPDKPPPPGVPAESGGDDFERQLLRQRIDDYTRQRSDELFESLSYDRHDLAEFARERAWEYTGTLIESMRDAGEAVPEDAREALEIASAKLLFAFINPQDYTDGPDYETFEGLVSEIRTTAVEQGGEPPNITMIATRMHDLASRMFLVKQGSVEAGVIPTDLSHRELFAHIKDYLEHSPRYPDESDIARSNEAEPSPREQAGEYVSFEPYRRLMSDISARLAQGISPEDIESYVAPGGTRHVFETPDGKIIKLPKTPLRAEDFHSEHIAPRLLGKGVRGLEQMVAYTEEGGGAIICEKAPGKTMATLGQEELDVIPPEHFEAFMNLSKEIARRGIDPDFTERNVLYDPQAGFTLVDYGTVPRAQLLPDEAARLSWGSILPKGVFDPRGQIRDASVKFLNAYRDTFGQPLARALEQEWYNQRPPRASE